MSSNDSEKTNGLAAANPANVLQECLACGVLVIDSRERIAVCTPEAAAHLRLKFDPLLDSPLDSLPAPFPKLSREATTSGKPILSREIIWEHGRGETVLRANIFPVKAEVVIVVNNLTSAPAFEQSIRRLDRLASLGTLSAGMAHEIKNGMVAIKTFVELLLQKGRDSELTDVVGRELRRIDGIVTQMLRFGTPSRVMFATVCVHDVLNHSLRLVEHQMSGKLISLNRNYKAATDAVRGDEFQLQQAFMNLLFNAIEAMGASGALTVNTEIATGKNDAGVLKIQIQDTGVGVAPENLGRLFEPFFTTKKNGTGLGLAISQRIVHEHHGAIEVQSEPDKGSMFSILLPVSQ
ncbi:MAG: two-component system sensor histidine kinase NtrB [Limisphaerales bacterium]